MAAILSCAPKRRPVRCRPGNAAVRPPGGRWSGRVPHDRGMTAVQLGTLSWLPAEEHLDLLGKPVAAALAGLSGPAWVAAIDDDAADTAAFTDVYGVPAAASANCVVVAARRAGETTLAACLVLATTRADVNGLVRQDLGARKASFAPQDVAVAELGMAYRGITPIGRAAACCAPRDVAGAEAGMPYGGIPPIGLPASWPVLVDAAVAASDLVVIGSGTRGSKLAVSGAVLAALPGAEVLEGRGQPWEPTSGSGQPPAPPRPERAPDDSDVGWGERLADPDDDDRRY